MKKSLRLPAFAKINLCLHVLRRAGPTGYHELRTIFQAISLRDTLELSLVSSSGITVETDDPSLPTADTKISSIARSTPSPAKISLRGGVHARLEKRIPVARGLGGGSRAMRAGGALIGMLRLTKKKIPLEIAA